MHTLITRGLAMAALILSLLAQSAPASADTLHDSLANAVNAYRTARGLPTVVASPTLQAAAQFMADDVARHGPPAIPHQSSDGRTAAQRMADAGYPASGSFLSEIIAWGAPTAADAIRMWNSSAPHYAMLNDARFRAAGYGVACWGAYPCVWVVTFGSVVDQTFGGGTASILSLAAEPPSYHAAWAAQSAFPVAAPGETVGWVVAFTNTGTTGWSADAGNPLHVGTAHPEDAPSILANAQWLSPNRPGQQTTPYVGPGQIGWFRLELTAPAQAGTYRLYVRPVIDGVTWLEDSGVYVDLVVR